MYDLIIVGAGASGIFAAYEAIKLKPELKILIIEKGYSLEKRKCPIDGVKIKGCMHCKSCAIMNGFGGAGAFSDGKYNITNNFGGDLYQYIGKEKTIDLLWYVDKINLEMGADGTKLYSTANSKIKEMALRNDLHLLDAQVRHLGTDINYKVLTNMYNYLKNKVEFKFNTECLSVEKINNEFEVVITKDKDTGVDVLKCSRLILATGRSGSKWISEICAKLGIKTTNNRVDIGVRVELPAEIFNHITNDVYESKIVYRTKKYGDFVRTFCMNPYGIVVTENTNGIVTVNGHSYSNPSLRSPNTNFALLVSNSFTEPFKNSNEYGESIARLSNLLGGGVIVQRLGDLLRGQRSTEHRIEQSFTVPTLKATPGDLSLVIPKRQLDDIIEMIYALDKIAPGTANDSTLLYGVEVKFYNCKVELNNNLETKIKDLYILGDGSGVSHSLSHASASGVYVGRIIANEI